MLNRESGGHFRWTICGLLFFATTVNYIDRQIIGVLKPALAGQFGWSEIDYSNIVFAFQLAYAIGLVVVGRIMDRIGVRVGFFLAVLLWSIAAAAHGLVGLIPPDFQRTLPALGAGGGTWILTATGASVMAFVAVRFLLGLAEAGNFPASIRATAEWFPKKDRSLATGIFNAGSNVGAIVTPLTVPLIVKYWGWPAAFYITSSLGAIWLALWALIYRSPDRHPRLGAAELAYIRSDAEPPAAKIPWIRLLGYRQVWAFAVAKFLTDPIWWMYLFWVPDFLNKRHGLNISEFGPPLVVIYVMADFGSIGGGYLSTWLIKRGWSVNAGRKTAMLVCALCVVPILAASTVSSLWVAVVLIGLAASAHQGWSANLYTVVSDTMPRQVISSTIGFGGMAGAIGGMCIAKLVGYILTWTHNSYMIPFAIAASAYLVAFVIMHAILPRLQPMKLDPPAQGKA